MTGLDDLGVLVRQLQGLVGGRIVRGTIDTTVPTVVAGSGFSVVRNGVGDVTVSFAPVFRGVPSVVPGVRSTGTAAVRNQVSPTAASARLVVFDTTTNASVDGELYFIAIGS